MNGDGSFNTNTGVIGDKSLGAESIAERRGGFRGLGPSVMVDGFMPAGNHSVIWSANDVSTGVYLARINVGMENSVHKVVLLK